MVIIAIITYWTKYLTGQNTILDKIPYRTKYRTGQNTAHDLHYALQFHRLQSQCQIRATFMHLNQAPQSKFGCLIIGRTMRKTKRISP